MIFHKNALVPAADSVDTMLVDCDTQVSIAVVWPLSKGRSLRHSGRWPIDGFSRADVQTYFQRWADEHVYPAEVLEANMERFHRRKEFQDALVTGRYPPSKLDRSDPLDAALADMRDAED